VTTSEQTVRDWVDGAYTDLVAVRRHLHAHPELGRAEWATTRFLAERLLAAGLDPVILPGGVGLWCDIGTPGGVRVMVRGDMDALAIPDEKDVPYRSTVPGVCHACGHDVHTTIVLGAALALARRHAERPLPGQVRLLFQHAEELSPPGGAHDAVAAGVLDGVSTVFSVHCDPAVDVGRVGLRTGEITSAISYVTLHLAGPGGHTARPYNTVDLVHALATVATNLPMVLSRTVDPRAALTLVWGRIEAGVAANAIPGHGLLAGTVRTMSRDAYRQAPALIEGVVRQLVAPFGASVEIDIQPGLPPVVNDERAVGLLRAQVDAMRPDAEPAAAVQSLGAEDFAVYTDLVPGALARLGTRVPGGPTYDLHQGGFDVDERAIGLGVRLLTGTATRALDDAQAVGRDRRSTR
jgi:amidohydrolase